MKCSHEESNTSLMSKNSLNEDNQNYGSRVEYHRKDVTTKNENDFSGKENHGISISKSKMATTTTEEEKAKTIALRELRKNQNTLNLNLDSKIESSQVKQ